MKKKGKEVFIIDKEEHCSQIWKTLNINTFCLNQTRNVQLNNRLIECD